MLSNIVQFLSALWIIGGLVACYALFSLWLERHNAGKHGLTSVLCLSMALIAGASAMMRILFTIRSALIKDGYDEARTWVIMHPDAPDWFLAYLIVGIALVILAIYIALFDVYLTGNGNVVLVFVGTVAALMLAWYITFGDWVSSLRRVIEWI